MTFIRACQHIDNFTAGHETRLKRVGEQRLAYPDQHIEADNRLSWYLGRLDETYGDEAFYVHLSRDPDQVAQSYARRNSFGIMKTLREGVLLGGEAELSAEDLARDYVHTVEANIRHFLRDKSRVLDVRLHRIHDDFARFWEAIGAQGDRQAALAEWSIRYNAST